MDMTKQVLSIQQMLQLQKLGIELKETLLYWAREVATEPRAANHYGKWILVKGKGRATIGLTHWEYVPAFTLQDILDILPVTIHHEGGIYELRLKRMFFKRSGGYAKTMWAVLYENAEDIEHFIMYSEPDLLNSAYNFLLHCINQGFINPRKEARP